MTRPMLWPALGLILGILASQHFVFSTNFLLLTLLFSLVLLCVSCIFCRNRTQKYLLAFSAVCLFSGLGFWSTQLKLSEIEANRVAKRDLGLEKVYWVGKIAAPCEEQEEGARFVVEAWELRQGSQITPLQGKVLLTVAGEQACSFSQGDVIQVYGKIKTPESYRNQKAFDYAFYLKVQGITATSFVESKDHIAKRNAEFSWLQSKFALLRQMASEQMNSISDVDSRQMLKAMLLGSTQKLSEPLQQAFRKTGTTHLLVVSGLHLAMVMALLYYSFRFLFSLYPPLLLRLSVRQWSYWASLPFLVFYSMLVGFTPSVLRSLLSIILVGFLIIQKRSRNILSLLYLVAFLLLFFQPLLAFDLSFQLSFLSLFSILWMLPPALEYLLERFPPLQNNKVARWGVEILLASAAVQIGLFPLIVNKFHQVSLFALPANLILIPYFSFILMPLGMLGLLFSWIHPAWASFFFHSASFFAELALGLVKNLASVSWSSHCLPGMNALQIILYASVPLVLLSALRPRRKIILASALVLVNWGAWFYPHWADSRRQDLRISFLDVGQGDSVLIEFPRGVKMLVDAGGILGSKFDLGEKVLLPTLLDRGIRKLDYLVLTHPHPDHYLGMKSLLQAYKPREFWWNGEKSPDPEFQALLAALRSEGIPLVEKNRASAPVIWGDLKIDFLHPHENTFWADSPDAATLNNHSLVMKIEDRDFSLLLTGDIQKEAEVEIIKVIPSQPVDLLKVPHHGSNTSSTPDFLKHFHPNFAVIQAGRNNRFGFPRAEVLENYKNEGSSVLGTYQKGEVDFSWDGKELRYRCESDC